MQKNLPDFQKGEHEMKKYPLSKPQQLIYETDRFSGQSSILTVSIFYGQDMDLGLLKESVRLSIRENDGMRLGICEEETGIFQYVHEDRKEEIPVMEFAEEPEYFKWAEETSKQPVSMEHLLAGERLYEIYMIVIAKRKYGILARLHHLIADAWTLNLLGTQIFEYYITLSGQEEPVSQSPSYLDFLAGEKEYQESSRYQKDRQYWTAQFEENPETVYLSDKAGTGLASRRKSFVLGKEMTEALSRFAKQHKSSVYILMMAAVSIYISNIKEKQKLYLGTALLNRAGAAEKNTVGMFVNTSAILTDAAPDLTFTEHIRRITVKIFDAMRHQKYHYGEVLKALREQYAFRERLFDVMISYQNARVDGKGYEFSTRWHSPGIQADSLQIHIHDRESRGELSFDYDYQTDKFEEWEIASIHNSLMYIIMQGIKDPGACIGGIKVLSQEQEKEILFLNPPATPYPQELTLQEIFEGVVSRQEKTIAITFRGEHLTYEKLNTQANQLANLLRKRGVAANSLVALQLERSPGMLISIIAVLKAGGAYVPIDPGYPGARVREILEDAGPLLFISDREDEDKAYSENRYLLEELFREAAGESGDNPKIINTSADLAYVMYTSGSTGKPKGNLIAHKCISRLVLNTNYIEIRPEDVMLQLSNYSFDGSVFDIFGAFLNGARLVAVEKDLLLDFNALADLIRKEKVNIFFATTALFNSLVDAVPEILKQLKYIVAGGERASVKHFKKAWEILGNGKVIHAYGPTESTVFTTCHVIKEWGEAGEKETGIPIGVPVSNTEVYVLSARDEIKPIGCAGEICISGSGLAGGYLNRKEDTAEKFVDNPFYPLFSRYKKMYRSGDLGRWLPDGNLEYVSRMDKQVKLRGFRIELGEIEGILLESDDVKEAFVTMLGTESSEKYLCAYLAGSIANEAVLRQKLRERLPEYMIPARWVFLDRLPLNKNGKVDAAALPLPETAENCREYREPENETEKKLQEIWQEVLETSPVSTTDSFYEIGGHSLNATVVTARIQQEMQVRIPVGKFLALQTIRETADFIRKECKSAYMPIPEAALREYYPVSASQRRVFVQEQFEGIGTSYHVPVILRIQGKPDVRRVEEAFRKLISRHEILRTSFHIQEDFVQRIWEEVPFSVTVWEGEEEGAQEELKTFIRPFSLAEPPLIRVMVLKIQPAEYLLAIDMHHIVTDGISGQILLKQFAALYAGDEVVKSRISYKDFAVWENGQKDSESFLRQKKYWNHLFRSGSPLMNFPYDFERSDSPSFEGDQYKTEVPPELIRGLETLALNSRVTLNSLLFAAYVILLYRYTGENDIVAGSLTAGRTHPDLQDVLGMFNRYLPIRNHIPEGSSIWDLILSVNQSLMEAYDNQDYPYDRMIEDFQIKRTDSRNPLFVTMLIYHNELESLSQIMIDGMPARLYERKQDTAKLDFKLDVYRKEKALTFVWEYSVRLFRGETIERMAAHYIRILEEAVRDPGQSIAECRMLTPFEERQILKDFNGTDSRYDREKTLWQVFAEQAGKTPERTAVSFPGGSMTYRALRERAESLSRQLASLGVKPEAVVGIMTQRAPEMIVGILAILRAGGAYMPISPDYPPGRIGYMLSDSGAELLLTREEYMPEENGGKRESAQVTHEGHTVRWLNLDHEQNYEEREGEEVPFPSSGNAAYVIYTSGSTGKPKGALIEHHSVINRINWMQKKYPLGAEDVILQKTPYTFDVSVWELFWWFFAGSRVYFLGPGEEKDPSAILKAVESRKVTTLHFVPSMLSVFLEHFQSNQAAYDVSSLRRCFASGEALLASHAEQFYRLFGGAGKEGAELVNLYGPTEATVDVSYYDCPRGRRQESIPIGKPIDNIRLYVLDRSRNLQPVGVPGELYISGAGVARGYLNRPELTAEKFMADPFDLRYRMYRTGDLAKWNPDGNLEYLGRIDSQVKIRGLRIELGEVENRLTEHEKIREAVAAAGKDALGNPVLCGYYVSDEELEVSELRRHLRQELPEYMVPSYFMRLAVIPLSANGKADRNNLPKPLVKAVKGEYREAGTETQKRLVAIWGEVLGVEKIGIRDNFFELGGDSLKLVRVIHRFQKEFSVEMSLNTAFEHPTVEEWARFAGEFCEKKQEAVKKALAMPDYPLSPAQERLFILNRIEGGIAYNLPCIIEVHGKLKENKVREAMECLTLRHESLRTSFHEIKGRVRQVIHREADFEMKAIDRSGAEEPAGRVRPPEDIIREFIRPFDFGKAPLMRLLMIKVKTDCFYLVFDIHHIIADGVSMVSLVDDFREFYRGGVPEPLSVTYRDYVMWQQKRVPLLEEQESFWMQTLKGTLPVLGLPTDYPRPAVQEFVGNKTVFPVEKALVKQLKGLAGRTEATLYMVLVAAYNILLQKYTGQEDICIGTPVMGRMHPDFERVVGMFVNTVVLRNYPRKEMSVRELVAQVKKNTLQAFENQEYPFEILVQKLNCKRDISRNPVFDTMLVLQNMEVQTGQSEEISFSPVAFDSRVSKFDLTLEFVERKDDLIFSIEYASGLFRAETIEKLAVCYIRILKEAVRDPDQSIAECRVFTPFEEKQILANRKKERVNLPEPPAEAVRRGDYKAAETETQKKLTDIWEEILGAGKIDIRDDFFDLGGNSLSLVAMQSRIEVYYPGMVKVTDLFRYTNIESISQWIDDSLKRTDIVLRGTALLPEFLETGTGERKGSIIKFSFHNTFLEEVAAITRMLRIQPHDFWIGAYVYLLSQMTADATAAVQVTGRKGMAELMCDMEEQEDLSVFLTWIYEERQNPKQEYSLEHMKDIPRKGGVTAAYLGTANGLQEINFSFFFDIFLQWEGENEFLFFFDADKLKKEKMKEFAGNYIKICGAVLEQLKQAQIGAENEER